VVNGVNQHEECHRKEGQQRFPIVHGRPDNMAGEEQFSQRNEVEDHTEAGRVEGDAAKQIAGAGQRYEGVDQADKVATQRETEPEQRHVFFVPELLSLPQIADVIRIIA